jgi:hypothetical protein
MSENSRTDRMKGARALQASPSRDSGYPNVPSSHIGHYQSAMMGNTRYNVVRHEVQNPWQRSLPAVVRLVGGRWLWLFADRWFPLRVCRWFLLNLRR